MPRPDRVLPVLAALVLAVAACGPAPSPSASGSPSANGTPGFSPATVPSKAPFKAGAWPQSGSACAMSGYAGLLGRIETPDARTIRFTLCHPDGAFPARLADPSLAILATSTIARLAADPASARSIVGSGPYRIERWEPGSDVILSAPANTATTGAATPGATSAGAATPGASPIPTIVLRWNADPGQRLAELQAVSVDAIDAPGAAEIAAVDTMPELALLPRAGLEVAYLAFGADEAFGDIRVRRAIASGFDRQAVVDAAFPPGSTVADYPVPCALPGACGGASWYRTNGPAAAADLAAVKFDTTTAIPIHVPDAPIPGLPDPAAAAAAVATQLTAGMGIAATVDVMPAAAFDAAVSTGTITGLYLTGAGAGAADAVSFLDTLFGDPVTALPATRVTGVRDVLDGAAADTDPDARATAARTASDAIRDGAPLVPIAIVGSYVATRADVAKLATSPLGVDLLGAATPGDRHQLVFMGTTEPAGAWCGDARSIDALRLCGLVSNGLYGFAAGTMTATSQLAKCTADADATTWTCKLRSGAAFADGTPLDAADVLATFVAQWDPSSPLRHARPDGVFAAWDALFGQALPAGG